jgi:hypothetical protein
VGSGDREQNAVAIVSHLARLLHSTPYPHLETHETQFLPLVMQPPERLAMQSTERGNNHFCCPIQLAGAFAESSSKKNCDS